MTGTKVIVTEDGVEAVKEDLFETGAEAEVDVVTAEKEIVMTVTIDAVMTPETMKIDAAGTVEMIETDEDPTEIVQPSDEEIGDHAALIVRKPTVMPAAIV